MVGTPTTSLRVTAPHAVTVGALGLGGIPGVVGRSTGLGLSRCLWG